VAPSIDADALGASLRRLQERTDPEGLGRSLQRVVDASVELFGLTGSGLMLTDEHGELRYVAATDPGSATLEKAQVETGQGPCVDSFLAAAPVGCADLAADGRYPELAARLEGEGVVAVLGVPVRLMSMAVGSLDLYCDVEHEWSDDERDALVRFGEVADIVIATAVAADRAGELADRLTYALDHRVGVERGVGYLMARDGLAHGPAFHRLRRAARDSGRLLGEVSDALLATGRLPGEPP
jgi:GAF domain-containing protein